MLKLRLISVGKLREPARSIAADYAKRIERYATFDERELRETLASADDIRSAIAPKSWVVALDERGTELTSPALAASIDKWRGLGRPLAFVIGGAHGFPPDFAANCDYGLSLSRLTLPHRLAKVLLLEQLYRAFTILNNEPYHHE